MEPKKKEAIMACETFDDLLNDTEWTVPVTSRGDPV
jgi:hypothetical protein